MSPYRAYVVKQLQMHWIRSILFLQLSTLSKKVSHTVYVHSMAVICSGRRQWYKNCLFELARGRMIWAAAGQSHVPLANCNQPFSFLGRRGGMPARPPSHVLISSSPICLARAGILHEFRRKARMSQGFCPLGTQSNFSLCHSCEKNPMVSLFSENA